MKKPLYILLGAKSPLLSSFSRRLDFFSQTLYWTLYFDNVFCMTCFCFWFSVFFFGFHVLLKSKSKSWSLSLSLSFQYKSCTLLPNRETEDMDRHAFKSHQIPCNPPVHTWWWWWSSYAFVHGEWKEEKLAFRQWTSWSMWSAFSWMSKINNPSSSSSSSSSTTLHTHTHSPHTFFTIYSCGLPSSIIMNSRRRRRRRRRRRNSSSSSSSRFVCK